MFPLCRAYDNKIGVVISIIPDTRRADGMRYLFWYLSGIIGKVDGENEITMDYVK